MSIEIDIRRISEDRGIGSFLVNMNYNNIYRLKVLVESK